jgi:GAF domain-containing protein
MSDSVLTHSLNSLSRFFVGDGTLGHTLLRVSELTVEAVPAADFVGLTLVVEDRQRTAVFTDNTATTVDQAQYDSGEGPCIDAVEHGRAACIESTGDYGRWPAFRAVAAANGIGSTMSLPLVVDGRVLGAMNLYARTPRAFSPLDQQIGELFASQAAIVVANAQAYWDARGLSERLGEAMKSRAVIEQAKGILMAAQRCDEDEAFDRLVRASQRENTKLRDVAKRIVATASDRESGVTEPGGFARRARAMTLDRS